MRKVVFCLMLSFLFVLTGCMSSTEIEDLKFDIKQDNLRVENLVNSFEKNKEVITSFNSDYLYSQDFLLGTPEYFDNLKNGVYKYLGNKDYIDNYNLIIEKIEKYLNTPVNVGRETVKDELIGVEELLFLDDLNDTIVQFLSIKTNFNCFYISIIWKNSEIISVEM